MEGENSELEEHQSNLSSKTLKWYHMANTEAKMSMTFKKRRNASEEIHRR